MTFCKINNYNRTNQFINDFLTMSTCQVMVLSNLKTKKHLKQNVFIFPSHFLDCVSILEHVTKIIAAVFAC